MAENKNGKTRRGTEFYLAVGSLVFQVVMVLSAVQSKQADNIVVAASVIGAYAVVCTYIWGRSIVKCSENAHSG